MSSVIRGSDDFNTDIIPAGRVASAWVNFNGIGVPAIRNSYNVASITDNGTGDYTLNYAVALDDVNYCIVSTLRRNDDTSNSSSERLIALHRNLTISSSRMVCTQTAAATAQDPIYVWVQIFGGV